jgi:hypothetical protein
VRFLIEQRFAGSLEAVEAALYSPALLAAMANLPKLGGAVLLEETVTGDRTRRRIRYKFTADLSAAVTAVVDPDKLTWVEESVHDHTTHVTTWRIVPDHYADRLTCSGTFTLVAKSPDVTLRRTEAEIKVHFPLVGGRVEKAIVSGLREHAADEERAVNQFLQS